MKAVVAFSGGKDSQASLIYAVQKYGVNNVEAVFCDTGWEHHLTYEHIQNVCTQMEVKLITLKSKKYDGMIDLAKKKKRFPSVKARFCTEELKSKPMIDWVLEQQEHLLIIQGIRKDESTSRSKMEKQCHFFRYYFEPYAINKKGKPQYHTYRKKDIIEWKKKYVDDIDRPVFDWTGQQVMQYILDAGQKPNPLYYKGVSRVGCMPCIMCNKREVKIMAEAMPDYADRLIGAENEINASGQRSNFFGPNYIPSRYCAKKEIKVHEDQNVTEIGIPSTEEVIKYVTRNASQTELDFDAHEGRSCMSFYGICE